MLFRVHVFIASPKLFVQMGDRFPNKAQFLEAWARARKTAGRSTDDAAAESAFEADWKEEKARQEKQRQREAEEKQRQREAEAQEREKKRQFKLQKLQLEAKKGAFRELLLSDVVLRRPDQSRLVPALRRRPQDARGLPPRRFVECVCVCVHFFG